MRERWWAPRDFKTPATVLAESNRLLRPDQWNLATVSNLLVSMCCSSTLRVTPQSPPRSCGQCVLWLKVEQTYYKWRSWHKALLRNNVTESRRGIARCVSPFPHISIPGRANSQRAALRLGCRGKQTRDYTDPLCFTGTAGPWHRSQSQDQSHWLQWNLQKKQHAPRCHGENNSGVRVLKTNTSDSIP